MTADADAHVIDDDEVVRESIGFLLHTAQLTVKTYETASAFLAVAPAVGSGCIITDGMRGMSGIDLLRRLKEMGLRLPVIVITGHGDVPLAVEAMKVSVLHAPPHSPIRGLLLTRIVCAKAGACGGAMWRKVWTATERQNPPVAGH